MQRLKFFKFFVVTVICAAFAATTLFAFDPQKEEGKPESHRAGWMAAHQQTAKNDSSSCKMCHNAYFCIDCHQRRDTITQRVHRRNFLFYHSVDARANPRKCDECHKLNFCTDCHRSL